MRRLGDSYCRCCFSHRVALISQKQSNSRRLGCCLSNTRFSPSLFSPIVFFPPLRLPLHFHFSPFVSSSSVRFFFPFYSTVAHLFLLPPFAFCFLYTPRYIFNMSCCYVCCLNFLWLRWGGGGLSREANLTLLYHHCTPILHKRSSALSYNSSPRLPSV